jgi:hypothetical protein
MSGGRDDHFDARLRRALAGIDTAPGFEPRLAARIAALPDAPVGERRARLEKENAQAARRLARDAWVNAATALGGGAAAVALVWRNAPVVTKWTEALLAAASAPDILASVACGALALGLWPVLKRYLPRV